MNLKSALNKINKKKTLKLVFLVLIVFLFSFFVADVVFAENWAVKIVGGIISALVYMIGWILMLVVRVLVYVASYNNFIHARPIIVGWIMVRDLANMFFIVILLIISFATILRVEKYNYKKWLPKLLLMAILINFSKTIAGLLIDVTQVVMLSFVNSFKDIGNYNFTTLLGIGAWGQFKDIEAQDSNWDILAAYFLMLVYTIISLVVMIAMTAVLVMRMIMIWIYVVLSPLAFLLASFPDGQSYASKWWTQFSQNLIVGPVLAFFIWLSFMTVNPDSEGYQLLEKEGVSTSPLSGTTEGHENVNLQGEGSEVVKDDIGTADTLLRFIIAIGMLIGGLKISQEIGGEAGSMAGKVSSKGFAISKRIGSKAAGWAGRQAGDVRDIASKKLGVDLNLAAGYKRYVAQSDKKRQLRKTDIRKATLEKAEDPNASWLHRKAALFSTGDVAFENIMQHKFLRGGSIKKNEQYDQELNKNNDEIKNINTEIEELSTSKNKIITKEEKVKKDSKIDNIKSKKDENDALINVFLSDLKKLEAKEESASITENEQKELNNLREEINKAKLKSQGFEDQIKNEQYDPSLVVENESKKNEKISEIDKLINLREEEKDVLQKEKEIVLEKVQKNKLAEVSINKAAINAELERNAAQDISGTSSSEELSAIFKEALNKGDSGMMAAAAKKMTKEGNLNDLLNALKLGTGLDGMIKLGEKMKNQGGMSHKDSLSLVSEIGEVAKAANHIQSWGVVSMNEMGNLQTNKYAEQQAAIYAEMAKIQPQKFVRDFNRLGTGHYEGGEHTAKNWIMDASTVKLFASKDKSYAEEMAKTGNINTIKFIASNPENIKMLEKNGAIEVAKVIKGYVNKIDDTSVENPSKAIEQLINSSPMYQEINK